MTFTTCPVKDNSWELRASEHHARHAQQDRHRPRRARSTSWACRCCTCRGCRFRSSNERKSGFLFPSIGNTSSGGLQLSVPYYWNIAPNAGLHLRADRVHQARHRPRRRPALPDRQRSTASSTGTTCRTTATSARTPSARMRRSRSRVRLNDVAELPDDFRLTVERGERERHAVLRGLLPGPGRGEHRVPERARRASPTATSTGASRRRPQQYQTIDIEQRAAYERPYARVPRIVVDSDWSYGETLRHAALRLRLGGGELPPLRSRRPTATAGAWT